MHQSLMQAGRMGQVALEPCKVFAEERTCRHMLPSGGSMAVCMEMPKGVSAPSNFADMLAGIKLVLLICKSLACSCTKHHQNN